MLVVVRAERGDLLVEVWPELHTLIVADSPPLAVALPLELRAVVDVAAGYVVLGPRGQVRRCGCVVG